MGNPKNDHVAPPVIRACRAAHRERDAKLQVDVRDGGERVIATRRVSARTPIAESELRKLVSSDLLALLNTTNLASAQDLSDAPEVRRSILNFGFPDLASRSIDERAVSDISRQIEAALATYEPRLARNSIKARRDDSVAADDMRVRFLVSAELRVQPLDVPVEFTAEVELDSGKVRIERL
jgi:type VI secretion system protein ImpF